MADTTYGSGELWIKDEAHMHLDWGGRLLPRPEGGGVVLFHSVYAPDVEPIGLPTGREVFTVVHVQTPDQRLLENPERFVLTFSST
jgi:hypothetical protein